MRAGAWSISSKGWGIFQSILIPVSAEPVCSCWNQAGFLLPGLCNLDSQQSFLSDGHTECLKLLSGPSPLNGHGLANAGHVAGLLMAHGEQYVFELPSLDDMVSPSAQNSYRPFQHLPSCVCKTHMWVQHCVFFLVHIAIFCREKVLTIDPSESLISPQPLIPDS